MESPMERSYWFARHSKPVIFLILTVALLGGYLAFTIPVAVFPETNFPRVLVAVDNGVMPIDQMMVTITRPIEEAVNSVPGLQSVRSITSRGSAEVDLFFGWNVDMFQTLQYVNAAISRVQPELPPTATVVANRMTFASFPIIGYSLTSKNVPQAELWEMATYEIKPRLNRVNGVSTVVVQGGQEPEFHVIPDPAKLLTAGVTVPQVLDALGHTNLIDSPGLLERNHQLELGLISGQVETPQQIADIVVKTTPAGVPVRIGDIGTVTPGVKPVYTIVTANGQDAVLLNINRQPESNTVEVADGVHQEVDADPQDAAPGHRDSAFLRSVDHRGRVHQECAGCDSDRADSGFDHPGGFPARLGNLDRGRPGDSGHDSGDLRGAEASPSKLQPDDSRRTGCGGRTGD